MHFLRKHLVPLGFKGTSYFTEASFQSHWYRVFGEGRVVIGLSNQMPIGVYRFDLNKQQLKAFQSGKLVLTPPGCCHATGGPAFQAYTWVHEGEIKTQRQLRAILKTTGLF